MPGRRKRCPHCNSLNTAEAISNNREGTNLQFFWICDNCDCSFSDDKSSPHYVERQKAKS